MNQRASQNNPVDETLRRLEEQEQELQRLRLENAQLKVKTGRLDEIEPIIGAHSGLKETMTLVKRAAPTDVTVLLLGETGAGKEVIAKAVHTLSQRCRGPFLRVNCGAISPELIDSELFGHEKGSFTGAETLRIGVFERANHGTLFLDEIGEMPEEAQVRLLRVLQDGVIQRVGGVKSIKVDVRVILATHRDLRQMIEVGRFRSDLWFRISTFPVKIPSLHSRKFDIEELTRHFLKKAGIRFGMKVPELTSKDIELLKDYSWPGNIRELAAVLDRALLLSNGEKLEVEKALGHENDRPVTAHRLATPTAQIVEPMQSVQTASAMQATQITSDEIGKMKNAIRSLIENALAQSHGRIEGPFGAALKLGLNPSTLRYKIKILGINPSDFKRP